MADRRKKTCPNEDCTVFQNRKKVSATEQYCKNCGTKLVLVCSNRKCYHRIEDLGQKHRMCERCEAARVQRIALAKDKAAIAAKKVAAPVAVVAPAVAKKVGKDTTKKVINAIANNAEKVIDQVPEKAVEVAKVLIKK